MGTEPIPTPSSEGVDLLVGRRYAVAVALAGLVGLGLMADSLRWSSATYDEVTYLEIAARWWRTGDQALISRMGSPLLFWKIQQAPVLWALDHIGHRDWVDEPERFQGQLLPWIRLGSLWTWAVALALVAVWSRMLYGPRSMVLAAWLFALSPNLLAHGALATMEMPLVAATTGIVFLFWRSLRDDDRRYFYASAAVAGLAWSFKYTTVLIPPILGLLLWSDRWIRGSRGPLRLTIDVSRAMLGFLLVMGLSNLVVTGFALLPMSTTAGDHPSVNPRIPGPLRSLAGRAMEMPIPQELVGFATQVIHQRSGGPSYLLGERRERGWWYYYLVALGVKVPLSFWFLMAGRILWRRRIRSSGPDAILPSMIVIFLMVVSLASSRNYGIRYLLPMAPLAVVWVSGLAEVAFRGRFEGPIRLARLVVVAGLLGQAVAVAAIHPHELTYFHFAVGGPEGGRRILGDSNLDWGQGLRSLARLQRKRPELRDLTFYYFGNADPARYGVASVTHLVTAVSDPRELPAGLSADTRFLAVSASLQWGPWGPEGYFRELNEVTPICLTDDHTIAIYHASAIGR
ncbi:ArnT family glycosyltransferase [Singulisphaera rosea]